MREVFTVLSLSLAVLHPQQQQQQQSKHKVPNITIPPSAALAPPSPPSSQTEGLPQQKTQNLF
jgi:hypothetical protein